MCIDIHRSFNIDEKIFSSIARKPAYRLDFLHASFIAFALEEGFN